MPDMSATSLLSDAGVAARLVSIQVGKPAPLAGGDGRTQTTSLLKRPVTGTVWLGAEDLEGNRQHDRRYHGGPDKAACAYPSEHYAALSGYLGLELPPGAVGENFTTEGLDEAELCVGDRFAVGDNDGDGVCAVIEVSQPRQPCATLSRYYGVPKLPGFIVAGGITGWYFRTVTEGPVHPGAALRLLTRPHPRWTISELNRLMLTEKKDHAAIRDLLADAPPLAADWRDTFAARMKAAGAAAQPA